MKNILIILIVSLFSTQLLADTNDDTNDNNLPFVRIELLQDFSALGEHALETDKVIMIEVSAEYCDYCHLLEEEIIKPMLRNADYTQKLLIRQIDVDDYSTITGIDGKETSHAELARQYKATLTPTLLFLDGNGNEVSPRIIGVNSLDLFGGYVDEAINNGLRKIRQPSPSIP